MREDLSHSTPSPLLRGTFTVSGAVKSARAYATAHGLYALELNGLARGRRALHPRLDEL